MTGFTMCTRPWLMWQHCWQKLGRLVLQLLRLLLLLSQRLLLLLPLVVLLVPDPLANLLL